MSLFGGPLATLYYMGFLPCCQKEEDKSAREALNQINTAGARIIWHRDVRKGEQLVKNVKKAAFSLFSSNKDKESGNSQEDDNNPLVKAAFKLYDNADGIPEIEISKRKTAKEKQQDQEDDDTFGFGDFKDEPEPAESESQNSMMKRFRDRDLKILISLKRIHTVVPLEQGLISLNILEPDGERTSAWAKVSLEAQDQNSFVHNLQVLMEWDRQRRNSCGELEWDETSAAVSIQSRAKKAAHFAKRELEMKQTKRSREERKAKYVAESGGLKFTALAMARNASAS